MRFFFGNNNNNNNNFAVIAALLALGSRSGCNANANANPEESPTPRPKTRIAIIGGGISGSFAAKYLSEYDIDCSLDITVFDPPPVITKDDHHHHQGSRVASHVLEDGTVIELGASVLSRGFSGLVDEMIEGSSRNNNNNLQKLSTTTSLGVYDGTTTNQQQQQQQQQAFPLLLSDDNNTNSATAMKWRYNLDLWRIQKATDTVLEAFQAIYSCLHDTDDESTFFDSPNDIWEAVGLSQAVSLSFDEYLDTIRVASSVRWWRTVLEPFLGDQGLLSSELCEPANILHHHQLNDQVTGLAGLINFRSTFLTGDDDDNDDDDDDRNFAIDGGNHKLIETAFAQASDIRHETCSNNGNNNSSNSSTTIIKRLPIQIQTLVSSDFQHTIQLFGTDGTVVDPNPYDIVVVATPLQLSGIEFMGKGSLFDQGLLYYLPLNEMVNSETSDANIHNHLHSLGGDHHLPSSVKRPYQQVVTTIIANGDLDPSYFNASGNSNSGNTNHLPQSILVTKEGFHRTGVSSIRQITNNGVYKVLSSTELSETTVWELFGDTATIEHTKIWGGPNGGAIPSFGGAGEASVSTRFLLYNGGRQDDDDNDHNNNDEFQSSQSRRNSHHHNTNTNTNQETTHAIYYTNAMESALSSIEIAAIGSKSVAKLIARRLGLVSPKRRNTNGEEL